jgi:hypothetical protein
MFNIFNYQPNSLHNHSSIYITVNISVYFFGVIHWNPTELEALDSEFTTLTLAGKRMHIRHQICGTNKWKDCVFH